MKTKAVPAVIMLIAGFMTCLVAILQHFSFGTFVKTEFLVLIIFYLFGCIVRMVLDRCFYIMQDPLADMEDMELEEDLIDEMTMSEDDLLDEYQDR